MVFIFIYSVFEVTLVLEAATKKTDSGTNAKTEGLITLATVFFFDRLHAPSECGTPNCKKTAPKITF